MNIYSYKSGLMGAEIKDVDGKKGIVSGYFSRFDNVDSDGDIIRKGAFAKTIRENGPKSAQPRIKHLMNHDPSMPLGKLIELGEDATGLSYQSQVGSHNLGRDFVKMVESGLITEHSIGFRIIKRNQLQDREGYNKNPAGGRFELTEIKLYEGSSLTAWGANPLTPITDMKSGIDIDLLQKRQKAMEKFCRESDATDETIEMLLLHSKQLSQYIVDLKATQAAPALVPDESEAVKQIQSFLKTL